MPRLENRCLLCIGSTIERDWTALPCDRVAACLSPTKSNEAPCSRLGYGVWSTPRTCSFSSFHSAPWTPVSSQYRTDSVSAVSSNRVHHNSFIFLLCWKRPSTGISRSLDGKQEVTHRRQTVCQVCELLHSLAKDPHWYSNMACRKIP